METKQQIHALASFSLFASGEPFALTSDGCRLCAHCVRANYATIRRASRDPESRDDWAIVGIDDSANYDDCDHCAHCYRELHGAGCEA
jgi:hypothetical protein